LDTLSLVADSDKPLLDYRLMIFPYLKNNVLYLFNLQSLISHLKFLSIIAILYEL